MIMLWHISEILSNKNTSTDEFLALCKGCHSNDNFPKMSA